MKAASIVQSFTGEDLIPFNSLMHHVNYPNTLYRFLCSSQAVSLAHGGGLRVRQMYNPSQVGEVNDCWWIFVMGEVSWLLLQ